MPARLFLEERRYNHTASREQVNRRGYLLGGGFQKKRHRLRVAQPALEDVEPLARMVAEPRTGMPLQRFGSVSIKIYLCRLNRSAPPMKSVEACNMLVQEGYLSPEKWGANLAQAQRLLSEALVDDSDNPLLRTCLGAVLCDQGQHTDAALQLRHAIAHGSQDRNTFFNLGVALLNSRSGKDAMTFFDKARSFQASPLSWQAYFDPQAH
ncbi:hypothetical protein VC218_11135 [Xanthomonas nasturtii]|uniref:tetratricopeptide repeat protein n=1 Tax=Xanthomonas nasturtii TaxID=1843581 RepID=UPI002B2374E5|nr:hypothetical protein [Xanthomonas nasturtii]MEA9579443.1 hypothetical protein [Xanthomonas nasturtii]